MATKAISGMFTGKKIFFTDRCRGTLKYKLIQILLRLEANIETFFTNNIDMVVTGEDDSHTIGMKRKLCTPQNNRTKKMRLMIGIDKPSQNDELMGNDDECFVKKALSMGCKVKSMSALWAWFCKFYGALVENCYAEDDCPPCSFSEVRILRPPALKVLDPFGGCRPLVVERYRPRGSLCLEMGPVATERESTSKRQHLSFCECCRHHYSDLAKHLVGEDHASYAGSATNFSSIDTVLERVANIGDFMRRRLRLYRGFQETAKAARLRRIARRPEKEKPLPVKQDVPSNLSSSESPSFSGCSCSCSSTSTGDDAEPLATSTPTGRSRGLLSLAFSGQSASYEDSQQAELNAHVSSIVQQLSCVSLPTSLETTPPLAQRFLWCEHCGRNHLSVGADPRRCGLPRNSDIDNEEEIGGRPEEGEGRENNQKEKDAENLPIEPEKIINFQNDKNIQGEDGETEKGTRGEEQDDNEDDEDSEEIQMEMENLHEEEEDERPLKEQPMKTLQEDKNIQRGGEINVHLGESGEEECSQEEGEDGESILGEDDEGSMDIQKEMESLHVKEYANLQEQGKKLESLQREVRVDLENIQWEEEIVNFRRKEETARNASQEEKEEGRERDWDDKSLRKVKMARRTRGSFLGDIRGEEKKVETIREGGTDRRRECGRKIIGGKAQASLRGEEEEDKENGDGRVRRAAAVAAETGIKNSHRILNGSMAATMRSLELSRGILEHDPRVRLEKMVFADRQSPRLRPRTPFYDSDQ